MRTPLSAALVLFFCGCATVSLDGHVLNEGVWKKDERDIRARASFELACSPDSLKFQVLAPWAMNDVYAGQVGVTGCEKRVVYVRTVGSGWVANSTRGEQAPKTAP